MIPLGYCLLLGAALFATGLFGALTRRNAIGVLVAIELMANAVNINLIAFGHLHGGVVGQVFTLFTIALTVAEVAIGLAILILLFRSRRAVLHETAADLRG
jgi:NADH-quinone oxidoreductase subunit K